MKKSSLNPATFVALACGLALAACSTSPQGRKQFVPPHEVSKAYSEADMRIQLATATSVAAPCVGVECTQNEQFDQQVQSAGERLALAAYDLYPDLAKRISAFQVEVADKAEPGTASNAAGKIIVYRGVQALGLDEAALAFLIAREMGHVIGQHHEENSGTRILLSIAASVLFPALNLFNGSAQVAQQATQVTSASALGTTVATTATSYVGSKAILASLKPDQLSEADTIGLILMDREGWHLHDVAGFADKDNAIKSSNAWSEDLRLSLARLRALDAQAQSTDLAEQPMLLSTQMECRPDDEPESASFQEWREAIPVMAAEVAPGSTRLEVPQPLAELSAPAAAASVEELPREELPRAEVETSPEDVSDPVVSASQVRMSASQKRSSAGKRLLQGKSRKARMQSRSKVSAKAPARKKLAAKAKLKKTAAGKPAGRQARARSASARKPKSGG